MPLHEKFRLQHHERTTAVFVIPPRVHLLDVSGPAHVFYEAADYGAPLDLRFVSVHPGVAHETSSSGLAFAQLEDFKSIHLTKKDIVFIPGIESHYITNGEFYKTIAPFFEWLIEQHQRGAKICSVCTGAFLLAQSGLLNGRQTTTHWKYHNVLKKEYPQVEVLANRLFVQSERIYSSAGVASGIDLGLYLLEELYGTRFSAAIAREVVIYLRRGKDDPQLSVFLQYRNHLEDRIHTVQEWLTQHLDKKHTADELAELIHTSGRNLTRLFKETTGITIGQYVEKLRIEHALQLLRDQQKVETVAKACGLQSTNQLRSLLRKHAGILPSEVLS
ncbi:MAG: AraC family transcriptional regulator [Azospira oryzae]|jgi:transcriptional regulator GlxA family with amidase domain|nr:AraC family transcriptional regulator [Cytophaga sp.]PZR38090.1 MAG: AraC family transcriptional regulator [Azospira oryzae]